MEDVGAIITRSMRASSVGNWPLSTTTERRRGSSPSSGSFDPGHTNRFTSQPVSLSPTEFTLLRYFIINAGTVLSKPKILDHVWRYDFGGDVNVVESYVSYLRRKIDTGEKRLLHTLRGVGYVLREPR